MTRKATDQVTTIGVDIGKTASTPSAFMAALGQPETFAGGASHVRSWGLSGRNRRESGRGA